MGKEFEIQSPIVKGYIRGFGFNTSKFAVPKIFTPKSVPNKNATYTFFDEKQKANRLEHVEVDGNSHAITVKFAFGTKDVVSKTISVKTWVSSSDQQNMVDPVLNNYEKGLMGGLTNILLTKREYDGAQLLSNAALYPASNIAVLLEAGQWDQPLVNPFDEISDGAEVVSNNGDNPNKLFLGGKTYTTIKKNPNTKNELGTASKKVFNAANLSDIVSDGVTFRITENDVIVGNAIYNASKGEDDPNNLFFWDKFAMVFYSNPNAKNLLYQKTFAQCFYPEGGQDVKVYRWTEDGMRGGFWLEVEMTYSLNIIDPRCAFVWKNVYAS